MTSPSNKGGKRFSNSQIRLLVNYIGTSPATGAEESPTTEGSAKMGKEEGTHTGTGQGVTPEHETAKIVQPPRAGPTTGGETPTERPTSGDQTGQ